MFLYEIGVSKPYGQRAVATMLIEKLKSICKEKTISIMYVGTEVDNLPAKRLYNTTGGKTEDIAWFSYYLNDEKNTK